MTQDYEAGYEAGFHDGATGDLYRERERRKAAEQEATRLKKIIHFLRDGRPLDEAEKLTESLTDRTVTTAALSQVN